MSWLLNGIWAWIVIIGVAAILFGESIPDSRNPFASAIELLPKR